MNWTADLGALGASLATPELVVVPVRHHSPACAWHLGRFLTQSTHAPAAVLIEGPRSFDPLVDLIADPQTEPPVAIYSYNEAKGAHEHRRSASFYPLSAYSPEFVALRTGRTRGCEVRFIDLDHPETALLDSRVHDAEDPRSLHAEVEFGHSATLTLLARRLGCRDHDELWEHLFEVPAATRTFDEHIRAVAAYCALARGDRTDEELAQDGTAAREAEMAWHVAQALESRATAGAPGPVVVVVGGMHAVVLPDLVQAVSNGTATRPVIDTSSVTRRGEALIRYSYDRLDRLLGYGAGMTSPAWHQRVWESLADDRVTRDEVALDTVAEVAGRLRGDRVDVPMPAVQAAFEQAVRLSRLRGRSGPAREDVVDAVVGCFVKGDADADGGVVQDALRAVLTGHASGRVPRGAGTPPVVADAHAQARAHRLSVDDTERRKAVLDLYRRPAHRETSRFLHALSWLEVPFAVCLGGPDFVNGYDLDRLQEHWEYSWTAATEARLVEASVYGATVRGAVSARFASRLQALRADGGARDAAAAAHLLAHACVLGLHDRLSETVPLLREALGAEVSFPAAALVTSTLALLWQAREPLDAAAVPDLAGLLEAAYTRSLFLIRDLAHATLDDDRAAEAVPGLARLHEVLAGEAGSGLDPEGFWDALPDLAACPTAYLAGAAAGLLVTGGRWPGDRLVEGLRGRLVGQGPSAAPVAYLRGVLETAREAAWQHDDLLATLDDQLRSWAHDEFVAALPELRLAFAGLTPRETDRVAEAVARRYGLGDLGLQAQHDADEADVQVNLALSGEVAAALAADGLSAWAAT